MKIHYFQRYHAKENVATANTMLLLSRLYQFSSYKFFRFLKSYIFSNVFEPEIVFTLQEKSQNSIPDATISQESFKIVVETKMSNKFDIDQLVRHLHSFKDEKYKVLISLAPERMDENIKKALENILKEYNQDLPVPIVHINTTFEEIYNAIQDVIDEKDYEMQEILDDFALYCRRDGLIINADSWRYMRVQLAGRTFAFNVQENLYYDSIERGFRPHDYLGLYKEKSVQAVGKISEIITAVVDEAGEIQYTAEKGVLTQEHKDKIAFAIEDGKNYGYSLKAERYFFVEKFIRTDFQKNSPRAPMGTRVFDLTDVLGTEQLPDIQTIAALLRKKTWV